MTVVAQYSKDGSSIGGSSKADGEDFSTGIEVGMSHGTVTSSVHVAMVSQLIASISHQCTAASDGQTGLSRREDVTILGTGNTE